MEIAQRTDVAQHPVHHLNKKLQGVKLNRRTYVDVIINKFPGG